MSSHPIDEASADGSDELHSSDSSIELPPDRADEEWMNAVTHGIAALLTIIVAVPVLGTAAGKETGLVIACSAYLLAVLATFVFSTLSHYVRRQPLLNTMRAWDQAMIYAMISGTYCPIAFAYLSGTTHWMLQAAIWIAAATGIATKIAFRHRINSVTTVSYLLLGWLPAIPLFGKVPTGLGLSMLAGGVVYTIGVVVLINDHRKKYVHAVWHLLVMFAAAIHCYGIWRFVINA